MLFHNHYDLQEPSSTHLFSYCLNVIISVTDLQILTFCPECCYSAETSHRAFNKDMTVSKTPNLIQSYNHTELLN